MPGTAPGAGVMLVGSFLPGTVAPCVPCYHCKLSALSLGCLPLPSNSKPKRVQQWDPLGSLMTQTVNVVITSAALEREKENVNEKRGTLSWVQGLLSQGERAGG